MNVLALLTLVFLPSQDRGRDVWILSTGGCIIDPRPKPVQPGPVAARTKALDYDDEVLVTFYKDREEPKSEVIWRFEFKKGYALRLYPYKNADPDNYLELTGDSKEKVRMSVVKDGTCTLTQEVDRKVVASIKTEHIWYPISDSIDPKSGVSTKLSSGRVQIEIEAFNGKTGFELAGDNLHTKPNWLNLGADPNNYKLLTLRPAESEDMVRADAVGPMTEAEYQENKEMFQVVRYYWEDAWPKRTITYELFVMEKDKDKYYLGLPRSADHLPWLLKHNQINTITIVIDRITKRWSLDLNGDHRLENLRLSWTTHGAPESDLIGKSSSQTVPGAFSVSVDLLGMPTRDQVGFTLHAKTISAWPSWVEHSKRSEGTQGKTQVR